MCCIPDIDAPARASITQKQSSLVTLHVHYTALIAPLIRAEHFLLLLDGGVCTRRSSTAAGVMTQRKGLHQLVPHRSPTNTEIITQSTTRSISVIKRSIGFHRCAKSINQSSRRECGRWRGQPGISICEEPTPTNQQARAKSNRTCCDLLK